MLHELFDFYNVKTERIVLASGSPRRSELLRKGGLEDFEVMPVDADETIVPGTEPHTAVMQLSGKKALAARERCAPGDLIIAADTVVSLDGEILGKPGTEDRAREMLKKLSGRSHKVFTGVTLRRGDMEMTDFEETEVFFREISESEIGAYIRTGEPLDKAGAYGIQGAACSFVYRLEGDYYNVMGLPMAKLCTMLKVFGVEMLK